MRIEKPKLIVWLFLFAFWVCATVPFVIQEATRSYLGEVVSMVWVLGEVTVLLLGLWTLKARVDKVMIGVFVGLSFIDTIIINDLSIAFWLNGCRLYIGFLFMFPIIRYFWSDPERRAYFVAKMDRMIYLYLVLQFPCMVVQCVRYGAWDNVSGSIGWMASGTASTIIYCSSFYLMVRRWNKDLSYIQNLRDNWVLLFLLLPTWMNETKISFIYIAMYFFFLVPMDRNFIKRMLVVLPLMALVIVGAGAIYYHYSKEEYAVSPLDVKEYMLGNDVLIDLVEYAFENDVTEVQESDYARGLKFYMLPVIFERHPYSWLTGFGVSQLKGGTTMDKTEFAKRYFWLLQGTSMQWYMAVIDMGIPGGLLYIAFWLTAFRFWKRHRGERNLRMSWMFGLMTALWSIYIPPFTIPPFYMQFMFMVFTCSRWHELPPYKHVPIFGSKKLKFSLHD